MPTLIKGNENISIHKDFYTALTRHSDSLALSQLWVCALNMASLKIVGDQLEPILDKYEKDTWNKGESSQSGINNTTLSPENWAGVTPHNKAGDIYLFVQGISFIADGLNVSRLGQPGVGATKGLVSDGRLDLNASNITFLETNVSFVDGFLRPWSVAVSHRSPKDGNLRCDIELFALQKWDLNEPLRVRKSMSFKNAFPISIDAEEYNYSGDKIINRQVQFAFDRYESRVYPQTNAGDITPAKVLTLGEYIPPSPQPVVEGSEGPTTILGALDNALGIAASVTNQVQGAANDITSTVAQGLHAVGANDAANSVSQSNADFNANVTAPAADIIGTGQGAVNGVQNIGAALGNITGSGIRNSTQIAQVLYTPQTPTN